MPFNSPIHDDINETNIAAIGRAHINVIFFCKPHFNCKTPNKMVERLVDMRIEQGRSKFNNTTTGTLSKCYGDVKVD